MALRLPTWVSQNGHVPYKTIPSISPILLFPAVPETKENGFEENWLLPYGPAGPTMVTRTRWHVTGTGLYSGAEASWNGTLLQWMAHDRILALGTQEKHNHLVCPLPSTDKGAQVSQ